MSLLKETTSFSFILIILQVRGGSWAGHSNEVYDSAFSVHYLFSWLYNT